MMLEECLAHDNQESSTGPPPTPTRSPAPPASPALGLSACVSCRIGKRFCDKKYPCGRCVKLGRRCVVQRCARGRPPKRKRKRQAKSAEGASDARSSGEIVNGPDEVEDNGEEGEIDDLESDEEGGTVVSGADEREPASSDTERTSCGLEAGVAEEGMGFFQDYATGLHEEPAESEDEIMRAVDVCCRGMQDVRRSGLMDSRRAANMRGTLYPLLARGDSEDFLASQKYLYALRDPMQGDDMSPLSFPPMADGEMRVKLRQGGGVAQGRQVATRTPDVNREAEGKCAGINAYQGHTDRRLDQRPGEGGQMAAPTEEAGLTSDAWVGELIGSPGAAACTFSFSPAGATDEGPTQVAKGNALMAELFMTDDEMGTAAREQRTAAPFLLARLMDKGLADEFFHNFAYHVARPESGNERSCIGQLWQRSGEPIRCLATLRWHHSGPRLLLGVRFWPLHAMYEAGHRSFETTMPAPPAYKSDSIFSLSAPPIPSHCRHLLAPPSESPSVPESASRRSSSTLAKTALLAGPTNPSLLSPSSSTLGLSISSASASLYEPTYAERQTGRPPEALLPGQFKEPDGRQRASLPPPAHKRAQAPPPFFPQPSPQQHPSHHSHHHHQQQQQQQQQEPQQQQPPLKWVAFEGGAPYSPPPARDPPACPHSAAPPLSPHHYTAPSSTQALQPLFAPPHRAQGPILPLYPHPPTRGPHPPTPTAAWAPTTPTASAPSQSPSPHPSPHSTTAAASQPPNWPLYPSLRRPPTSPCAACRPTTPPPSAQPRSRPPHAQPGWAHRPAASSCSTPRRSICSCRRSTGLRTSERTGVWGPF